MQLPFFYKEDFVETSAPVAMDEDTSKHIIQVLRMKKGDKIRITNGQGFLCTAEIIDDHRKRCTVRLTEDKEHQPPVLPQTSIAISLLKNSARFEWFLEKAAELGINRIVPVICERSEKNQFKKERFQSILVSAMLQSRQCWLTKLSNPVRFEEFINQPCQPEIRFIAHCMDQHPKPALFAALKQIGKNSRNEKPPATVLIGPEGDFSPAEIDLALLNNAREVSLGQSRLRTETAALVAATFLRYYASE